MSSFGEKMPAYRKYMPGEMSFYVPRDWILFDDDVNPKYIRVDLISELDRLPNSFRSMDMVDIVAVSSRKIPMAFFHEIEFDKAYGLDLHCMWFFVDLTHVNSDDVKFYQRLQTYVNALNVFKIKPGHFSSVPAAIEFCSADTSGQEICNIVREVWFVKLSKWNEAVCGMSDEAVLQFRDNAMSCVQRGLFTMSDVRLFDRAVYLNRLYNFRPAG